ncbi:hypothetical protein GCM10010103_66880 [Streptomyces paradoxus]|uniref:Uncharacterized protein n=1 Tax=Streptomyces paradoxus TaxID=66375 RepID=A0A7W9TJG9_9ACTN|nr:hypothetical protein [Streptomyces paradoxus]MBB6081825.1 hypothetical protein [Streptomyces paradoxus]
MSSGTCFTAEGATTGSTIPYDGEPLAELVPVPIDEAVRKATREYVSTLLARLGACGKNVGQGPFASAPDFLVRILDTADPGHRHLLYGVSATLETLVSILHADTDPHGATHLDDTEALELTTVLAIRLAALPGSLVMRTAAQGPQTASTAVGCERETSTPSRPETSSTPTAPTSTPVTPSHGEHYVGKIQYGWRGSDPYRRPTKVQFKDGELTTSCRMLHYSPLTDSPFSDSPYRGY